MSAISRWLAHPLARGLDPDDPDTTRVRRQIVASKPFLRRIYLEWYEKVVQALPPVDGAVLELGSGAGFFRETCPGAIATEVLLCGGVDAVVDARRLPFREASLRAIVMTDVMHHIPDCGQFLREAERVLKPGGRIVMVEPWVSPWSTFIYTRFHPEPFRVDAATWDFPPSGPLSGANGAIPWLIFRRDLRRFQLDYPTLELCRVEPFMPFRYLVSGGVSLRALAPAWTFKLWKCLEGMLSSLNPYLAMFALIIVQRR